MSLAMRPENGLEEGVGALDKVKMYRFRA